MSDAAQLLAFTAAMASLATLATAPFAVALAWLLARRSFPGKAIVETLVLLPLVVPPVATGLILLEAFGRRGALGSILHRAGIDVAFTWRGVVIAMAVMALPIFVLTARAALDGVDLRLEQVASTLGARPLRVFGTVTLPLAWPGLLAAGLLAFARCLGEFGATMLVAGAIPGRTATLATSIWQHVQAGQDAAAFRLVALSVLLALAATGMAAVLSRRVGRRA